jgi:hypothetical protein
MKDPAALFIDMIRVDEAAEYRSGRVANWLIDSVVARWPSLALRGGPLSQDDPGSVIQAPHVET